MKNIQKSVPNKLDVPNLRTVWFSYDEGKHIFFGPVTFEFRGKPTHKSYAFSKIKKLQKKTATLWSVAPRDGPSN